MRRSVARSTAFAAAASVAALVLAVPVASAESAPDAGRAWEPPPAPTAAYHLRKGTCPKPFGRLDDAVDPAGEQCPPENRFQIDPDHRERVQTVDGEQMYVEVWLPRATPEAVAPVADPVPVVALLSPYATQSETVATDSRSHERQQQHAPFLDILPFVEQGYAYAQVHVRGTGSSTGCFDGFSSRDADDAARVVEFLAAQPWSTGRVGLIGASYEATAALNVAARGDKHLARGLSAVIAVSPLSSPADLRTRDGVLIPGLAARVSLQTSTHGKTLLPGFADVADASLPGDRVERAPCRADDMTRWGADPQGGVNAWEHERDLRRFVDDVRVPTLFTMGLQEVQVRSIPGFFDQLGRRAQGQVQKVGLFGQWGHHYPDANQRVPEWARADWNGMELAWFDRHLRKADNGVQHWPTVQVQDTTGQWRTEPDFPRTGGPVGQLVLGDGGLLGSVTPTDAPRPSSPSARTDMISPHTVIAPRAQTRRAADTSLLWETEPLAAPLRITGEPVLDVWVRLARPAGQLVAELVAVDGSGEPLPLTRRMGARSLSFLDPVVDGHFRQQPPTAPPTGQPLRVEVRFDPADLVVPVGGRLQLRLAAVGPGVNGEVLREDPRAYPDPYMTGADPAAGDIEVLRSCDHLSALRFLMPSPTPDLIDVRETDQQEALGQQPSATTDDGTGGGLATQAVCGQAPTRLDSFGPAARGNNADS